MYRFPHELAYDKKADQICREHINKNLLRMVNRHISEKNNEADKKIEVVGEEASYFFPHEYWGSDIFGKIDEIVTEKFITLRHILIEQKEITPELLLEYVVAKMCDREEFYTHEAVLSTIRSVVANDKLCFNLYQFYDRDGLGIYKLIPYAIENKISVSYERTNGWNGKDDDDIYNYHKNVRLMIKEMLDRANGKRGKNTYTKKEAIKFLNLIDDGKIDDDFSLEFIADEVETDDNRFAFKMYTKKFGHPCVYKIPESDREYVLEKLTEMAKDVFEESYDEDEITSEKIEEYVQEMITNIEDTRTYEGSDHIFWDWDYTLIDTMGTGKAIDFVSDVLGDGPSVGGIRY